VPLVMGCLREDYHSIIFKTDSAMRICGSSRDQWIFLQVCILNFVRRVFMED
jgi:hypothetical protein